MSVQLCFVRLIWLYRDKCIEFWLILQNIFVILILSKEAWIVIPLIVRRDQEVEDTRCLFAVEADRLS